MKQPSKKQIEVLIRIAPGPIGQGMKIKDAAKDLGISEVAVNQRLQSFKKRFPNGWARFEDLRKRSRKDRFGLYWRRSENQKVHLKTFTELFPENAKFDIFENWEDKNKIKEIF